MLLVSFMDLLRVFIGPLDFLRPLLLVKVITYFDTTENSSNPCLLTVLQNQHYKSLMVSGKKCETLIERKEKQVLFQNIFVIENALYEFFTFHTQYPINFVKFSLGCCNQSK